MDPGREVAAAAAIAGVQQAAIEQVTHMQLLGRCWGGSVVGSVEDIARYC
jgi:hypothetical protein